MNDWDKLLYGLIGLALVAVLISSPQTSTAISGIGAAITKLAGNIAGKGAGNGQ